MKTRLLVSGNLFNGSEVVLDGERARYLGRVLRLRVGDDITVFNGEGPAWSASVAAMTKNTTTLRIGEETVGGCESPLKAHLVQGISRGERMDYVVQKATELGVKRITPVLTEYSVVKLDESRAAKRRDHWTQVAASACEQSGRTRLPLIDAPLHLGDWFGNRSAAADVDLILAPGATSPLARVPAPEAKVCILIGPEGGFSASECDDARIAGFTAVSLGPRILRTETAAAAALAVMQSLWGDFA
ncbi:MAG: 16S rRNA (uracil(1498)-N(3))-methyltransferase [Gammaproteobacteria bacterium]|nr:16S rRNA (uracil(1498)-N(3))-methyltransferase [Gammaproteobacteria bacterium]